MLVGANAVGNAAIDTGWGFVTLGYGEPLEVFDTSGEGYATSYALARVGFELLAGAGLGSAAGAPGKLGKAALIWDVAGNGSSVGRGNNGVVKDGQLNFEDGVQIFGGGFGFVGNFGGALSKAGGAAEDLAKGSEGLDDFGMALDDVAKEFFNSGGRANQMAPQELIDALKKRGYDVFDDADIQRHLDRMNANASTFGQKDLLLRTDPRKLEVVEEWLHNVQQRLGIAPELRELHVADFMHRHRTLLGLDQIDTALRLAMELIESAKKGISL